MNPWIQSRHIFDHILKKLWDNIGTNYLHKFSKKSQDLQKKVWVYYFSLTKKIAFRHRCAPEGGIKITNIYLGKASYLSHRNSWRIPMQSAIFHEFHPETLKSTKWIFAFIRYRNSSRFFSSISKEISDEIQIRKAGMFVY